MNILSGKCKPKPQGHTHLIPTRKVIVIKAKPQVTSIEKDVGKLVPLYIIGRKWKTFAGSSQS